MVNSRELFAFCFSVSEFTGWEMTLFSLKWFALVFRFHSHWKSESHGKRSSGEEA